MKRRDFIINMLRGTAGIVLLGASGYLLSKSSKGQSIYQIDPGLCTACGKCTTICTLTKTAVKCVNDYKKCGYCVYCYGYFSDNPRKTHELICKTGALKRRRVGEFQYEYTIDNNLCTACGQCVIRCKKFGNGTLSLQINRDLCKFCNSCSIERLCPHNAIKTMEVKS